MADLPKGNSAKRQKTDEEVSALQETPADIIAQYEAAMAHQKAQSDKILTETTARYEAAMAEEKIKADKILADTIALSDKTIAQKSLVIAQKSLVIAQKSLESVLTGSDFLEPFPRTLKRVGTDMSHSNPPNQTARNILSTGGVLALDLVNLNKKHVLELEKSTSSLRATICVATGNELTYANESAVHHIVHCALQDATYICNKIIEKLTIELDIPKRVLLDTRPESPLFSNRCDHVVVYDSISDTPVFVVETKKPWGDEAPTSRVFGQVFDQLKAMSAWGHNKPIGALTSFNSSYIVWLNKTLSNEEALDWESLGRIVKRLALRNCDQPSKTPSPIQKRAITQTNRRSESPITDVLREVYHSERFASHEIVSAFVNAIFRSLKGMQHRVINDFKKGSSLNVEALSIWEKESQWDNSYKWVQLQMKYKGPLLWSSSSSWMSEKIYLVDYLGMGATSKAYRALTYDGYDCVVKMYVKRYVDNEYLEAEEFDSNAKAAVSKEVEEYHTIYPELKGYVGSRILYGYQCVIHPYFEHPPKDRRNELERDITRCLKKFGKHKKKFQPHDQLWQHVGYFDKTLYLFDLGNLDKFDSTDTIETVTKSHYARLMGRT